MRRCLLVLLLVVALGGPGVAGTLHLMCSQRVKLNLDGDVIGSFKANTPIKVKNIERGDHKLYCKSLQTWQLRLVTFTFGSGHPKEHKEFVRFNPPKIKSANVKARRRTTVGVVGLANEFLGRRGRGRKDRRKILVGVAGANEILTKRRTRDRRYARKYGNTLEIKANVRKMMVNIPGVKRRIYRRRDRKRFHHLPAGTLKVYLRNERTGELKTFRPRFPRGEVTTVTLRPRFAPPNRRRTNEKARRRNTLIAGGVLNEALGRKRRGRKDIRKGVLAGTVLNEFLTKTPSEYYKRHKPVKIDMAKR